MNLYKLLQELLPRDRYESHPPIIDFESVPTKAIQIWDGSKTGEHYIGFTVVPLQGGDEGPPAIEIPFLISADSIDEAFNNYEKALEAGISEMAEKLGGQVAEIEGMVNNQAPPEDSSQAEPPVGQKEAESTGKGNIINLQDLRP